MSAVRSASAAMVVDGGATRPMARRVVEAARHWADSQYRLVVRAADFADSTEWVLESPTAAHWLAGVADVEPCTSREWIRIGRELRDLPGIAAAFEAREVSYSKVRTLTRVATAANEAELLDIARRVPAAELGRALAAWRRDHTRPEDLDAHHRARRSVSWRTEADGMVLFSLRLPPLVTGLLIAALTGIVMRGRSIRGAGAGWPSAAQQYADAMETILTDGMGEVTTEVVLHVRGDGATLDDGTPITETVVERIAPTAFLRAMIHDAEGHPVDVSNRRRHPTTRQRRLVKERDRVCRDCGRADLLVHDHVPDHSETGHTVTGELELRCAPCHHRRHRRDGARP